MPKFEFKNYLETPRPLNTPLGIFRWPQLQEARLNDLNNKMEYQCTLAVKPENASQLITELDALYQENLANVCQQNKLKEVKGANKPYGEEKDKEGVPTGYITFRTKALAGGLSKKTGKEWSRRIKLFNRDLSPFAPADPIVIGGGTQGKLQFDVTGYYVKGEAGIKLNLTAAQIFKVVQAGKNSGKDFGFSAEENLPADDVIDSEYDPGETV